MAYRTCIVSPEIVGPHKNGGIGTHVYYLAKLLAEDEHQEVTVLYTGSIAVGSVEFWRKHFKQELNVRFVHESELQPIFNGEICRARPPLTVSQKIYQWLKHQPFDVCHFQDYCGHGFVPIQAKRTGKAFHNMILTCMTHSSHEWVMQAMQMFPHNSAEQLVLDFMERYCSQYADIVISPSQYMFDWAEQHGWKVNDNRVVLPCLLDLKQSAPLKKFSKNHIIFFGRLETRKGLEIFINALNLLHPRVKQYADRIKISFLGKIGASVCGDVRDFIEQFFKDKSDTFAFQILDDKSHSEAIDFLVNHADALIVTPSLIDNFPCAVLECVELNLNIISSDTGGIPEIFADSNRLFNPNAKALAQKIEECFRDGMKPLNKKYALQGVKQAWKQFHTALNQETTPSPVNPRIQLLERSPFVSVCIPYYNCGNYLPDLLFSLSRQTYQNFEVIVVNDGSTQPESLKVFEQMQKLYQDRDWKFLTKENGGLSNARNFGAKAAQGDYLIFVDADNAAEPQMVESMVQGMLSSGADCLTCYFRAFDDDVSPFAQIYAYAYCPIGACVESGMYENVFGDANMIVKTETFSKLGGFTESRTHTWEDWEFLVRLTLSGHSVDVIPEFLVLYRHRSNSLTRTTSSYGNQLFAISPYFENQPLWMQRFMMNAVGSFRFQAQNSFHDEWRKTQDELRKFRRRTKQLRSKVKELELELEKAHGQVAAMETSKFWKLRQRWFKAKKLLGLPLDE